MDTKYYYMMGLPASGKTTFLVAFTYMLLEQTEKVCLHMKPQDVQEGLTEEFKKEIERWTNFESLHHTGVGQVHKMKYTLYDADGVRYMKNYLSGLLGAVQKGETKEAELLIQGMLHDGISNRTSEVSRSGNIVVDSLVNHKYALAVKDGIKFEANVFIPASLPFRSGHLAVILGNLLENALEACREVPEGQRYISLDISYVKEMLQICIRNSYHGTPRKDSSGRYLTTKKDILHHGIGLSSVEQAVSCYHGELAAEETGTEFRVSVVMYAAGGEK